jgi:hypothetical protein
MEKVQRLQHMLPSKAASPTAAATQVRGHLREELERVAQEVSMEKL